MPLVTSSEPSDLERQPETVLVRVTDADGRVGIGEADAPRAAVRELVHMDDLFEWSRGLRSVVLGADPFEVAAVQAPHARTARTTTAAAGSACTPSRAVDIALHDLAGKQLGRPAYQLLGGARRDAITPYATIWPGSPSGRTIGEVMDAHRASCSTARWRSASARSRWRSSSATWSTTASSCDCIREGRRLLGARARAAARLRLPLDALARRGAGARRVEDCDMYLAEATLQHDDLDGHARLAARVADAHRRRRVRRHRGECREWLERGRVDVLQPDVDRCGGLTELRRIAELAAHHGAEVVPHGWKTGITAAAAAPLPGGDARTARWSSCATRR